MASWHNISARSTRNKYLKDMWQQWRGVIFSYDEGLVKGDAAMAAAVWRNLFHASKDADVMDVARVVVWLRRELKQMEGVGDDALSQAKIQFSDLGAVQVSRAVEKRSEWMSRAFEEDGAGEKAIDQDLKKGVVEQGPV